MIVSHLIEAVLISVLGLLLRWENKKRDRIQSQMEGGLEGRDLDSTAFLDLTDRENMKYEPNLRVNTKHYTDQVIASDTSTRMQSWLWVLCLEIMMKPFIQFFLRLVTV